MVATMKSFQFSHPRQINEIIISISSIQKLDFEYFLKTYFNACYHLLLCPFNVTKKASHSQEKAHYVITEANLARKILCSFLYFLDFFLLLGEIRAVIPGRTNNLGLYFLMMHAVCDTVLKLVALKQFWWNLQEVAHIINFASTCGSSATLHNAIYTRSPKFISKMLVITFTTFAVYFWASGTYHLHTTSWSPTTWWNGLISWGRFSFFLEGEFTDNWAIDAIIGSLTCISFLHRKIFGGYTDLLIIMAAVTVQRATANFLEVLYLEDGARWHYVRREYETVKRLCARINTFWGKNIGLRLVVLILTWAFSINDMFFQPDGIQDISKFLLSWYWAASLDC